jgi:hypothetical protein
MINQKGLVRQWSRPNFQVLCGHSPGRTEENHENPVRIASYQARFENGTSSI